MVQSFYLFIVYWDHFVVVVCVSNGLALKAQKKCFYRSEHIFLQTLHNKDVLNCIDDGQRSREHSY